MTLRFALLTFVVLSVSRVYLILDHYDRVNSLTDLAWMLVQGARVDCVILGYFFVIPLLVSVWLAEGLGSRLRRAILNAWLTASFILIVFMEVVTPEFIFEYDIRPNRLFIDYLAYPAEVSQMLWEGYKPAIFLSLFSVFTCLVACLAVLHRPTMVGIKLNNYQRMAVSMLILLVGLVSMRSSLQHRPFNPSMVYFSNDNLVNSLVLNSTYSVLYAAYNAQSERPASQLYGPMSTQEIIRHVRAASSGDMGRYVSKDIPTLQYHQASYRGQGKNIVILLQESLGSRFVASLGGEALTPNLDALMAKGWTFTHAFATGTRSVRGIEAVFTGFSPGPSRSVVKLSKSQSNFFSIATLLKEHGYFTQFIYGGESHFDNMKSFFLGNGVSDIHDITTFKNPAYLGSWGASDEDLYNEAHQQFEALSKQDRPFFSLVFTSSNHSPWEFPDSCNGDTQGVKQSRGNAIRYSDCTLGKFFEQAEQSNYWDNTVFLIIADHDARVYGSDMVPIEHFKIPALIIGKGITPQIDNRLVSQIDFAPTLLSLAGISDYHPMIGFDLTQEVPSSKQRAMMQYDQNYAWMDNNKVIVIRPNLPPKAFQHDGTSLKQDITDDLAPETLDNAQANALWSSLAYEKSYYRLPDRKPEKNLAVRSGESVSEAL